MTRAVPALTAVAVLGLATLAFANSGSKSDPSGDVKHDPPGADSRYDIVKVAYNRAADGTVTATVKTKGMVFGPNGQPGAPVLWIDVPGKVASRPGCQYSDYFVAGGEVDQCGDGPKTGDATVKKVSSHILKFTFALDAIGNPPRFGIAFVTQGTVKGRLVFFDRAPDKGLLKAINFVPTEGSYSGTDDQGTRITFSYSGGQITNFRGDGFGPLFEHPVQVEGSSGHFSSTQRTYIIEGGWNGDRYAGGYFRRTDLRGPKRHFDVQLAP